MTLKNLLLLVAIVGVTPSAVWAIGSLVAAAMFRMPRPPIWLSAHLYSKAGRLLFGFRFYELPVFTSVCILSGAALLIFGITIIPRSH